MPVLLEPGMTDTTTVGSGMNTCKGCGQDKPLSAYPVRGRQRRKHVNRSPYCTPCTQRFQRDYYLNGGRNDA